MDFIGNKKVVSQLVNSLSSGKLNHAYIFSGPEKVGKFTLAKNFALSLIKGDDFISNSDTKDKDALLDLIIVEPEILEKNNVKKQRNISIEKIRDAKRSLSLFPYHGRYKVLIINDAHKMNTAAQNGLLKILEEPNETTKIILITHEPDKILSTIFSRCQILNFGLASEQELLDVYSKEIAGLSLGRPGYSFQLSNGEEKDFALETIEQLNILLTGSINEKFNLAELLSKDLIKTLEKFNLWLWQLRKKALVLDGQDRQVIYDKIEKIGKSVDLLKGTNSNSRLILESLFMDL